MKVTVIGTGYVGLVTGACLAEMGRPIVTTDAVGCREVVDDGVNGYLCKPRDVEDLAAKMEQMIVHSPEERSRMGRIGREKMEREFDEQIVIRKYLEIVGKVAPAVTAVDH